MRFWKFHKKRSSERENIELVIILMLSVELTITKINETQGKCQKLFFNYQVFVHFSIFQLPVLDFDQWIVFFFIVVHFFVAQFLHELNSI